MGFKNQPSKKLDLDERLREKESKLEILRSKIDSHSEMVKDSDKITEESNQKAEEAKKILKILRIN